MSDPKLASPLTRRTRAVARQRVNGTTGDIDPDFVHDIAWTYPRFSHNICLTGSAICTNIGGAWAARHELLRRRGRLRDKCPHPTKILILEDDNPPRIYSKFVSRTKPGSREHALKLMNKFRALLAENRPTIDIGLSQPVITFRRSAARLQGGSQPHLINMVTGAVSLTPDEENQKRQRLERIRKLEQPAVAKVDAKP